MLIPMKGTPMYMRKPKAVNDDMTATMIPNNPNHGLALTQSDIRHTRTLNTVMIVSVTPTNGLTEFVLASSSSSMLLDVM